MSSPADSGIARWNAQAWRACGEIIGRCLEPGLERVKRLEHSPETDAPLRCLGQRGNLGVAHPGHSAAPEPALDGSYHRCGGPVAQPNGGRAQRAAGMAGAYGGAVSGTATEAIERARGS